MRKPSAVPSGCVAGIAVSRPTGTKNAASTRASISKSCTRGRMPNRPIPTATHGQHHADQEALQCRRRIVERGKQAAGRRRQRSRPASGRPAGADPEGAHHQDRERRREARQQGEAVIVVQLLRRMGVHGERRGKRAAAGLDMPRAGPACPAAGQPVDAAAAAGCRASPRSSRRADRSRLRIARWTPASDRPRCAAADAPARTQTRRSASSRSSRGVTPPAARNAARRSRIEESSGSSNTIRRCSSLTHRVAV